MPLRADPDAVGAALLDAIGHVQRCATLLAETDVSTRGRWSIRVAALKLAVTDCVVTAADGEAWRTVDQEDDDDDDEPA